MKKTLSEKLAENLAYYVNDPKKRCNDGWQCRYSGTTLGLKTKGCFVGAFIPGETRKRCDKITDGDVFDLINDCKSEGIKLPEIITNNAELMNDFQALHDGGVYWDDDGLSNIGRNRLTAIIKKHSLKTKPFQKFMQ